MTLAGAREQYVALVKRISDRIAVHEELAQLMDALGLERTGAKYAMNAVITRAHGRNKA
jgi:hypothetical protein